MGLLILRYPITMQVSIWAYSYVNGHAQRGNRCRSKTGDDITLLQPPNTVTLAALGCLQQQAGLQQQQAQHRRRQQQQSSVSATPECLQPAATQRSVSRTHHLMTELTYAETQQCQAVTSAA